MQSNESTLSRHSPKAINLMILGCEIRFSSFTFFSTKTHKLYFVELKLIFKYNSITSLRKPVFFFRSFRVLNTLTATNLLLNKAFCTRALEPLPRYPSLKGVSEKCVGYNESFVNFYESSRSRILKQTRFIK